MTAAATLRGTGGRGQDCRPRASSGSASRRSRSSALHASRRHDPGLAARGPAASGVSALSPAITRFMNWLVDDATFGLFTFREATRAISAFLDVPLTAATAIFSTGLLARKRLGRRAARAAAALDRRRRHRGGARLSLGRARLALLAGGAFLYLAVFGQWASAMADARVDRDRRAVRRRRRDRCSASSASACRSRVRAHGADPRSACRRCRSSPICVPILFLFGFGPVAALIATIIYAMPPMVRVTMLALEAVPREIVEFGTDGRVHDAAADAVQGHASGGAAAR